MDIFSKTNHFPKKHHRCISLESGQTLTKKSYPKTPLDLPRFYPRRYSTPELAMRKHALKYQGDDSRNEQPISNKSCQTDILGLDKYLHRSPALGGASLNSAGHSAVLRTCKKPTKKPKVRSVGVHCERRRMTLAAFKGCQKFKHVYKRKISLPQPPSTATSTEDGRRDSGVLPKLRPDRTETERPAAAKAVPVVKLPRIPTRDMKPEPDRMDDCVSGGTKLAKLTRPQSTGSSGGGGSSSSADRTLAYFRASSAPKIDSRYYTLITTPQPPSERDQPSTAGSSDTADTTLDMSFVRRKSGENATAAATASTTAGTSSTTRTVSTSTTFAEPVFPIVFSCESVLRHPLDGGYVSHTESHRFSVHYVPVEDAKAVTTDDTDDGSRSSLVFTSAGACQNERCLTGDSIYVTLGVGGGGGGSGGGGGVGKPTDDSVAVSGYEPCASNAAGSERRLYVERSNADVLQFETADESSADGDRSLVGQPPPADRYRSSATDNCCPVDKTTEIKTVTTTASDDQRPAYGSREYDGSVKTAGFHVLGKGDGVDVQGAYDKPATVPPMSANKTIDDFGEDDGGAEDVGIALESHHAHTDDMPFQSDERNYERLTQNNQIDRTVSNQSPKFDGTATRLGTIERHDGLAGPVENDAAHASELNAPRTNVELTERSTTAADAVAAANDWCDDEPTRRIQTDNDCYRLDGDESSHRPYDKSTAMSPPHGRKLQRCDSTAKHGAVTDRRSSCDNTNRLIACSTNQHGGSAECRYSEHASSSHKRNVPVRLNDHMSRKRNDDAGDGGDSKDCQEKLLTDKHSHPQQHVGRHPHPQQIADQHSHPQQHAFDRHPHTQQHDDRHPQQHVDQHLHPQQHVNQNSHPQQHADQQSHPQQNTDKHLHTQQHANQHSHPQQHADQQSHPQQNTDKHSHPQQLANQHSHTQQHADRHPHPQHHVDRHPHSQQQADGHTHPKQHTDGHPHSQKHVDQHPHPQQHTNGHTHPHPHVDGHPNPHQHADGHPHPKQLADRHPHSHQLASGHTHPQQHSDRHLNPKPHADGHSHQQQHADEHPHAKHHADGHSHSQQHVNRHSQAHPQQHADRHSHSQQHVDHNPHEQRATNSDKHVAGPHSSVAGHIHHHHHEPANAQSHRHGAVNDQHHHRAGPLGNRADETGGRRPLQRSKSTLQVPLERAVRAGDDDANACRRCSVHDGMLSHGKHETKAAAESHHGRHNPRSNKSAESGDYNHNHRHYHGESAQRNADNDKKHRPSYRHRPLESVDETTESKESNYVGGFLFGDAYYKKRPQKYDAERYNDSKKVNFSSKPNFEYYHDYVPGTVHSPRDEDCTVFAETPPNSDDGKTKCHAPNDHHGHFTTGVAAAAGTTAAQASYYSQLDRSYGDDKNTDSDESLTDSLEDGCKYEGAAVSYFLSLNGQKSAVTFTLKMPNTLESRLNRRHSQLKKHLHVSTTVRKTSVRVRTRHKSCQTLWTEEKGVQVQRGSTANANRKSVDDHKVLETLLAGMARHHVSENQIRVVGGLKLVSEGNQTERMPEPPTHRQTQTTRDAAAGPETPDNAAIGGLNNRGQSMKKFSSDNALMVGVVRQNKYKGKEAVDGAKNDQLLTLSKGWINFYTLNADSADCTDAQELNDNDDEVKTEDDSQQYTVHVQAIPEPVTLPVVHVPNRNNLQLTKTCSTVKHLPKLVQTENNNHHCAPPLATTANGWCVSVDGPNNMHMKVSLLPDKSDNKSEHFDHNEENKLESRRLALQRKNNYMRKPYRSMKRTQSTPRDMFSADVSRTESALSAESKYIETIDTQLLIHKARRRLSQEWDTRIQNGGVTESVQLVVTGDSVSSKTSQHYANRGHQHCSFRRQSRRI